MEERNHFGCYVIGGDTLLIECVDLLIQAGHTVHGVITGTRRIAEMAETRAISVIDIASDYISNLEENQFDFLLSITHLDLIPAEVLALPRQMAVNFHDGPLPAYAGLNTPAWALMDNEEQYGITWHVITPGIDEGDILLQSHFDVAADETSLSLNTKCFAAALDTFPKLIDSLASGNVDRTPQDLVQRSYFSKYQRPESAGTVDWSNSAVDIEALVRALEFGDYPNPIGSAKLVGEKESYIIKSAVAQDSEGADVVPGGIISIKEGELSVGTGAGTLTITELNSITGNTVLICDAVNRLDLETGKSLTIPTEDFKKKLTALNEKLCRSEEFWTKRLARLETPEIPYAAISKNDDSGSDYQSIEITIESNDDHTQEHFVSIFALLLARLSNKDSFDISFSDTALRQEIKGFETVVSSASVLRTDIEAQFSGQQFLNSIAEELKQVSDRKTWLKDLIARQPELHGKPELHRDAFSPIGVATENESNPFVPLDGALLTLVIAEDNPNLRFVYDANRLSKDSIERICRQYQTVFATLIDRPDTPVSDIKLLSAEEAQRISVDWNQTNVEYPKDSCIHQLFEQQVTRKPDSVALAFENNELTYRELDQQANRLALELISKGVGPDVLVGVYVERSLDLMVSTLGVLKAGGAYVPLDPAFPADRIKYMIEDAQMPVIVTQQKLASQLPDNNAELVVVDEPEYLVQPCPEAAPATNVTSSNLAYVIYTSGSTGQPKGVMVEHRNVVNFFTGMDAQIPHDPPGTWLAVTSLSFDISVLELFWTLARGFKVVIYLDRDRETSSGTPIPNAIQRRPMAFGLFMWGNDDAPGRAKYKLMLEGAKYFDENGFDSVWTPERHFHAFGGPYPNPAVTGAALAAITNNLSIRAGSCVSPLHHPIRIAEDWAVIDNLSNGRVGLSFASGWQPNDFVIKPENHKNNKAIMLEQIETVRKLWRGEKVAFENPMGNMVETSTLPRPVQKELPVWVTTAGNPETYKQAGAQGANVLTHLLGQNLDELAGKIKLYREARKQAGFDPDAGQVTLMLHTFVGNDNDSVRELVREPMKDYLRSAMKLVLDFAWAFPAFKRPGGADAKVEDVDIKSLSEEESETILDFAFERYFENSGLFGTPETCIAMVNRCKQVDIDEIACLLDFGVATDDVMGSLSFLKQVRDATNETMTDAGEFSFPSQAAKHEVTHLQCTPSMARMLSLNTESRETLSQINHLMIGGEALPVSLANELTALNKSTLTNMYGPTETTIWSTTQSLSGDMESVPIGRPIANTKIYILDKYRQPSPPGVPGELFIGGEGVVRGYLNRPELTAERFIANPFDPANDERIYWTGDLACYRDDGVIDFLGRIDHQVKIRGYRIELGEIENALDQNENIRESVVILREDTPGDQRLVAYYVVDDETPASNALRELLGESLPDYMVPSDFVVLEQLPLTPNGKVDRNALPDPKALTKTVVREYEAPKDDLEEKIAGLWRTTLNIDQVSANDNFFDLGGHSLLVVRLHSQMRDTLDQPISLTDLYRFPTIRSLTEHLNSDGENVSLQKSSDRAQRRREMVQRRRRR